MAPRRSGLGRGLSSLIPPGESALMDRSGTAVLLEIPVSEIVPNPHQLFVYDL